MALQRQHARLLMTVLALLALVGCTRRYHRQQADDAAYCLIDQKAAAAQSVAGRYRVDPDARSRMFDPFDPDHEPMPPDDPTSHRYMRVVDGKRGAARWRKLPRTPFVDNPNWQQYLPLNQRGELVLDHTAAVDVALLHSPNYQEQLETLYLSALDVSFERFRFDTQFFGGSEIFFTADGRARGVGPDGPDGNSSSLLVVSPSRSGNPYRATRLTATGGELVVGIANSLVWQFSGPDDYTGNTLLDFSLVQPLLRGAGRTRVLERLTISERALLANIRAMERYRTGFYLSVVTGEDAGDGPSRRGGFFGGAGLDGFSGVGGGGFGRAGNFNGGGFGGGGGGGFTGGAGAQSASGFYGLLQSAQELRNQRANVVALRQSVEQLAASQEAGRIDRFQVDLARQALYNAQSQLLTAETFYLGTKEAYQVNLGLPPELMLKLDDPLLDQFELLDSGLTHLQDELTTILGQLRERRNALTANELPTPGETLPGPLPVPPVQATPGPLQVNVNPAADISIEALIAETVPIAAGIREQLAHVGADLKALEAALPKRSEILRGLATRDDLTTVGIDIQLLDPAVLEERYKQRTADILRLEQSITLAVDRLDALAAAEPNSSTVVELASELESLGAQLLELSLVQASLRLDEVTFDPIELEAEEALAIASAYRLDWMNARAALVDSWRLIYFNANDLRSDLSILFSGDISNRTQNPFDLRSSTGRLRVGMQWDPPLTRVSERNVYRQSLIEFQQARRSYYQYRDGVYLGLRNTLRQLKLNEVNFELRRAAVQLAISQVDLTQLRLSEPPQVGATEQFTATTARDLVQSLSDLLNVQNDFLSVWVNYEVERLNLEFALGVLHVDARGQYIPQTAPLVNYLAMAQQAACQPGSVMPGAEGLPPTEAGKEIELQVMPLFSPEFPLPAGKTADSKVTPAAYQQKVPATPPRRLPAATASNGTSPRAQG